MCLGALNANEKKGFHPTRCWTRSRDQLKTFERHQEASDDVIYTSLPCPHRAITLVKYRNLRRGYSPCVEPTARC